jgi:hypothetical protein
MQWRIVQKETGNELFRGEWEAFRAKEPAQK